MILKFLQRHRIPVSENDDPEWMQLSCSEISLQKEEKNMTVKKIIQIEYRIIFFH
jgi:hypothetical protein